MLIAESGVKDADTVAKQIAASLQKRELMLKLLSVNLYDLEENSRMDCLISFKKVYARSRELMLKIMRICNSDLSDEQLFQKMLAVFAYLHGIYPYCYATKKQSEAMQAAGIKPKAQNIYGLSYEGLKELV